MIAAVITGMTIVAVSNSNQTTPPSRSRVPSQQPRHQSQVAQPPWDGEDT